MVWNFVSAGHSIVISHGYILGENTFRETNIVTIQQLSVTTKLTYLNIITECNSLEIRT